MQKIAKIARLDERSDDFSALTHCGLAIRSETNNTRVTLNWLFINYEKTRFILLFGDERDS
jgi:hypothetical protein